MKNFIKLHITLIKYLIKGLPKKKTIREKITFLKETNKNYVMVWKNELKQFILLFNKDFQKQKKEYEEKQQIQKDLQRALRLLDYIDTKMEKKGYNRTQRRQFWRDFGKKGELRKEIFEELTKEVNAWR